MRLTPIADVLRKIQPLPPVLKAAHLRGMIASERKHSIRRHELEAALKHVVNKDLQRSNREAR